MSTAARSRRPPWRRHSWQPGARQCPALSAALRTLQESQGASDASRRPWQYRKIRTQGAEFSAFGHAGAEQLDQIDQIVIEYHWMDSNPHDITQTEAIVRKVGEKFAVVRMQVEHVRRGSAAARQQGLLGGRRVLPGCSPHSSGAIQPCSLLSEAGMLPQSRTQVHTHINNYGPIQQVGQINFPTVWEVSYINKEVLKQHGIPLGAPAVSKTNEHTGATLDQINNGGSQDITCSCASGGVAQCEYE